MTQSFLQHIENTY